MTFVYLICFLLVTVGILFMLKLTPEKITNDLMRFVSPKQTLRDTTPINQLGVNMGKYRVKRGNIS